MTTAGGFPGPPPRPVMSVPRDMKVADIIALPHPGACWTMILLARIRLRPAGTFSRSNEHCGNGQDYDYNLSARRRSPRSAPLGLLGGSTIHRGPAFSRMRTPEDTVVDKEVKKSPGRIVGPVSAKAAPR